MTQQQEKTHTGVERLIDKLQDVVGGMAGRMSASMVQTASQLVAKAGVSDMYELEAARVALQRSSSPEIKALARNMIMDHTTSTHQLQAALEMSETRGVPAPPDQLDERHRTMIENLEGAPANKFDSTYLDQQVLAHEEALTLLVHYRDHGDNPQLRSCAAGTAPVVYRHLQHAKALREQL